METISAHQSVKEQYNILKKDGMTNTFDRAQAQGKRCSFCEQGISCQLCSNGPCRIKPGAERGVCGIDADAMANAMTAEINSDSDVELSNVLRFAPKSRIELWRKLGILPGGPLHEVMDSVSSTMTNIDGDYVSLAKKALRLGISCIYGSQIPLEMGQDILFGTPQPHAVNVDLGIIDPTYVNIAANGHEPFIGAA